MLFTTLAAWSQDVTMDSKTQKEMLRQQKKAARAEEKAQKALIVEMMVRHATFVLEADMLYNKYGNGTPVSSNINFVASDSLSGILQVGSGLYLGSNGVGGVTVEGRIIAYEYTYNAKRGYYNITYSLATATGTYDIVMSVSADGRADATIRSNWPGSLRYSGKLVLPGQSKVYKGYSRY